MLDRIDSDASELKTVIPKNLMKPSTYSNVISRNRSNDSEDARASRSGNESTRSAHSLRAAQKRLRKNSQGEAVEAYSAMELPSNTIELVRPPRKGRM